MSDLREVHQEWVQKGRQSTKRGLYPVSELWNLREYTWTRSTSRSGMVEVDGQWQDLRGPEKWDAIKASMSQEGWNPKEPLWLALGKDGNALVVEGNHRLAIAKELGIRNVPVEFDFRRSVQNGKRIAAYGEPMSDLKENLIRLGAENEDLQEHLRPILAELEKSARPSGRDSVPVTRNIQQDLKQIAHVATAAANRVKNLQREAAKGEVSKAAVIDLLINLRTQTQFGKTLMKEMGLTEGDLW